jgi:hypothetical protein
VLSSSRARTPRRERRELDHHRRRTTPHERTLLRPSSEHHGDRTTPPRARAPVYLRLGSPEKPPPSLLHLAFTPAADFQFRRPPAGRREVGATSWGCQIHTESSTVASRHRVAFIMAREELVLLALLHLPPWSPTPHLALSLFYNAVPVGCCYHHHPQIFPY